MDTIFAETTPPGRGGVSIVRISGPDARAATEALVGHLPMARRAEYRAVKVDGETIDHGLVLWFEAGASFTGEEIAEIHLHGAPVIVKRVQAALSDAGLRYADAGEFTRRAFETGKIDLSQAEGLADLLAAETESQRKLAMQTASGALRKKADHWRELLIRAGALVEASVDFADEDLPEEVPAEVFDLLDLLKQSMAGELAGYSAAERLRSGFEVAVIGPPNSGKSSFINRLAGREVAIVSEIEGTTRDIIELRYDLRGIAVTFLDTAGLRATEDRVEAMGVDLAKQRAQLADVRVHLSVDGWVDEGLYLPGDFTLHSKADESLRADGLSAVTGQGFDEFLGRLHMTLAELVSGAGVVSHGRQAAAITAAHSALDDLVDAQVEILAENIRQASASIDELVGRIGAEDYLDVIFSTFCVGK